MWGLTFVMVHDAIEVIPTLAFLAYRFIPASLLVGIPSWRKVWKLSRDGWRAGTKMGVYLTAGYLLQTFGLEHTTPSHAGFITGTFVVLTPLFGALFYKQRVATLGWGAAVVAFMGLFLLSGAGAGGKVLGDLLVLACACSFALHLLVTDRAIKNHDLSALVTVQLGLCGVVSLIAAAVLGDLELPRSAVVWEALVVTSIFASVVGFWVLAWVQRHVSPARTALILASDPAFAGLFAYVLAGETLSPLGWTGALLIMGAIAAVEVVAHLRPSRRIVTP